MIRAMMKVIIRKYWRILLGMTLICALGCAAMTGLSSSYQSLKYSLQGYLNRCGMADAVVTLDKPSGQKDLAEKISSISDIEEADPRFSCNTVLKEDDGRFSSVRMLYYSEKDRLHFHFRKRAFQRDSSRDYDKDTGWSPSSKTSSVYVEYKFAKSHDIDAGDYILVRSLNNKNEYHKHFVSGLISNPETLAVTVTEGLKAVTPDLGYIYAPKDALEAEVLPDYEVRLAEWEKQKKKLKKAKAAAAAKYESAMSELDTAQEKLDKARSKFNKELPALNKKKEDLQEARKKINVKLSQSEKAKRKLNDQKSKLQASNSQALIALDTLDQLEDGLRDIEQSPEDLPELKSTIDKLKSALSRLDNQTDDPKIHDLIRQLSAELDKLKLSDTDDVKSQAERCRSSIDSLKAEIYDLMKGIVTGLYKVEKNLRKANNAQKKAKKALKKTDGGINAINKVITDNSEKLRKASNEIKTGRSRAKAARKSAMTKLRRSTKELRKAGKLLSHIKNYELYCNQFLLYFSQGAPREETLKSVKAVIQDSLDKNSNSNIGHEPEILSSVLYQDSAVKAEIDANITPLKKMTGFVPLLLFGMSLMTEFLFFSLIILQMRRKIGIWRALGTDSGQIRTAFCLIGLIVSVGSALLGALASFGLARLMDKYFIDYFSLPVYDHLFDTPRLLVALLLTAVVCQAAVLLATHTLSRIQPAQAMSRSVPDAVDISPLLSRLTSRLNPMPKFTVISLLRKRGRFIFSAVCLACTVVLIFTSLSFMASKDEILKETFGQRIHYDCQSFLTNEPKDNDLSGIDAQDGVSNVQKAGYYGTDIRFAGKREHVVIYALEAGTDLIGIYNSEGKSLPIPEKGLILEQHTADALGVKAGDRVQINDAAVRVEGISHQSIERAQYISLKQAEYLGAPASWMLICNVTEKGENGLSAYLADQDKVVATVFTRAVKERIDDVFKTLDLYIWTIIIFSAILGMIIIITTSQHNLMEVKVQLCTLRSLGFQHGEVSRFWFAQSLFQYIASCIIGLLAGYPVARFALHMMNDPQKDYPFSTDIWPWAITLGIVFVYVVISHLLSMRLLNHWDIAEVTKGRE